MSPQLKLSIKLAALAGPWVGLAMASIAIALFAADEAGTKVICLATMATSATFAALIIQLILSRQRERDLQNRVDDLEEALDVHLMMNEWRGSTGRRTNCVILPMGRPIRAVPTPRTEPPEEVGQCHGR